MRRLTPILARKPCNHPIEFLIPLLSTALWFVLAGATLIMFREPLTELLHRIQHVKVPGLELDVTKAIDKSAEQLKRVPESSGKVPEQKFMAQVSKDDPLRSSLIARWSQMQMPNRKLRILLVHDEFLVAKGLREPFSSLGIEADLAICAQEARSLLMRHRYDVVVSDIRWDKCTATADWQRDGVSFLQYAQQMGFAQPTVFYIANLDRSKGTPPFAAGITNNWYETLHFILDVVSRDEKSQ